VRVRVTLALRDSPSRVIRGPEDVRGAAPSGTLGCMADVLPLAAPGDFTVAPLFGWQAVAVLLALLLAVVLAAAVLAAARGGRGSRPDWQAWLDSRSTPRCDDPAEPDDRAAGPGR
jgi:hypothetical protein